MHSTLITNSSLGRWRAQACCLGAGTAWHSPADETVGNIQVAARRGGRSIMYQDESQYVLLEPGQDEAFVTPEELQRKLEQTLGSWEGEWPQDLRKYQSTEEAAAYLMESVCELDLGGSLGAMQWYSVRLE